MKIYEILRESDELILDSKAWDLKLKADMILNGHESQSKVDALLKEIFKFILTHGDQLMTNTLNQLKDVAESLKELENNNEN